MNRFPQMAASIGVAEFSLRENVVGPNDDDDDDDGEQRCYSCRESRRSQKWTE